MKAFQSNSLGKTHSGSSALSLDSLRLVHSAIQKNKLLYITDDSGTVGSSAINVTDFNAITGNVQTVFVDKAYDNTGRYFTTIAAAVTYASILLPTSINPIMISVNPGVYVESKQIVIPNYVNVKGSGIESCIVTLSTSLASGLGFIELNNFNTSITQMFVDAGTNADYSVKCTQGIFIYLMLFGGGRIAAYFQSGGVQNIISNSYFYRTNATQLYGLYCNVAAVGLVACGVINLLGDLTGAGIYMLNSKSASGDFRPLLSPAGIVGWSIGCKLDNSRCIHGSGVNISCTTAYQLALSDVLIQLVDIRAITYNITADASSSVYINGAPMDISQLNLNVAAQSSISIINETLDGFLGFHQIGNFASGSKSLLSNTFLGQGAWDFQGVSYLKYNGVSYTDVSSLLKMSVQTNVTLFDSLTLSVFYFGDDVKFYSLQCQVIQALAGTVIFEYWNGSAWTSCNHMNSQNSKPYGSYSNVPFNIIEHQEIRFDIRLSTTAFAWTKTSVNSVNKYWIRCRPAAITVSPILHYLRLLYSSTRVDSDGILLKYGNSRIYKSIIFDINVFQGVTGVTPTAQDILFGAASRVGRSLNSLATGQQIGISFFIPNDCCSSSPFKLYLAYCSSSILALQTPFTLQLTVGSAEAGDPIYFTTALATGQSIRDQYQLTSSIFDVNQTNGRNLVIKEIDLPLPFIKSRNVSGDLSEIFCVDVQKLAGTNANSIVFVQIIVNYLSFSEGTSLL